MTKHIREILCVAVLVLGVWHYQAHAGELPNLQITPGVARDISLAQICTTKWGKDVRLVSESLKQQVYAAYGLENHVGDCNQSPRGCEIDHLISRENGGADDIRNLWAQHYGGSCGAEKKDRLENEIHKLICSGQITIEQGQTALSQNWIAAYAQYVDVKGCQ